MLMVANTLDYQLQQQVAAVIDEDSSPQSTVKAIIAGGDNTHH